MRWYEHSLKKVRVNYGILIFGLLLQSLLLFTLCKEALFSSFVWGLWAFMSIPYLILFFANRYINRTNAASSIITAAVLILATVGILASFAAAASMDPLGGVMFIFVSIFGTIMGVFFSIIAIVFNKQR